MRWALVLGVLLALWAPPANAATKTYSSGTLRAAIPDGGVLESAIRVPDAGALSSVQVAFRLDHSRDSDLSVSLISPSGTAVRLVRHAGGTGANFGRGARSCRGELTVVDEAGLPIAGATAPFVGVFTAEQRLSVFAGEQARGGWTLRTEDGVAGHGGTLFCWRLRLSFKQTLRTRRGAVRAEVSFSETAEAEPRLRIVRRGRTLLDRPLRKVGSCAGCADSWQPVDLVVRDLDADGEPEVLFDAYTGGAHCCTYSLVFDYDRARHAYRKLLHWWGNVGYRLADLDRDGRREFRSADDRFAYEFTSFADSRFPVQIWRFRRGRMLDITDRFPGLVRREAGRLWLDYLGLRDGKDVRGLLAAWMADIIRLGREDEGWRKLEAAYRRGDLGPRVGLGGWPQGRAYLRALRAFLRKTGYLRS